MNLGKLGVWYFTDIKVSRCSGIAQRIEALLTRHYGFQRRWVFVHAGWLLNTNP